MPSRSVAHTRGAARPDRFDRSPFVAGACRREVLFVAAVLALGCAGQAALVDPSETVATVASIQVSPTSLSFSTVGEQAALTAVARDQDGDAVPDVTFEWETSNAGVAAVSEAGVVTAMGEGSARITATVGQVTSNEVRVGVTLDSPPPPAPPAGCEAEDGARCWYVDAAAPAGGSGSEQSPFRIPQDAATRAGPGDYIYLAGTFTTANAHSSETHVPEARGFFVMGDRHADGAEGRPITLKTWPGRTHLIRGDSASQTNLNVGIGGSYWRVEGLRIRGGYLIVAWRFLSDIHDVTIVDADVCCAVSPPGNTGLIRVHEGTPSPYDILVENSRMHDLYACEGQAPGPCAGPTVPSWSQAVDTEHHACFMIQNASGQVELRNSRLERCSAIVYLKREGGSAVIRNNTMRDAVWMGVCRFNDQTFEGNTVTNVGSNARPGAECVSR